MTARPNAGSSELVLAVSELVSNALQYALHPCWLRLLTSEAGGWVRVEGRGRESRPTDHGTGGRTRLWTRTRFANRRSDERPLGRDAGKAWHGSCGASSTHRSIMR